MTDEQIDHMLQMHRHLIKCELETFVHRFNREPNAEKLQELFNDKEWEEFAKWFKLIRDND